MVEPTRAFPFVIVPAPQSNRRGNHGCGVVWGNATRGCLACCALRPAKPRIVFMCMERFCAQQGFYFSRNNMCFLEGLSDGGIRPAISFRDHSSGSIKQARGPQVRVRVERWPRASVWRAAQCHRAFCGSGVVVSMCKESFVSLSFFDFAE